MAGNLLYGGGRYTGAITNYLAAVEDARTAPYAEYGLGVIYLAMNEEDAALGRFDAAGAALDGVEHGELRYRLHYNRGIVLFEKGDFSRAAAEFRAALESGPGRVEAKRNLELSLLSLDQRRRTDRAARTEREAPEEGDGVLYEYLRREEEKRWRSQEWTGEAPFSGPDY